MHITREEAIKEFQERIAVAKTFKGCDLGNYPEAMEMAIEALKEKPAEIARQEGYDEAVEEVMDYVGSLNMTDEISNKVYQKILMHCGNKSF